MAAVGEDAQTAGGGGEGDEEEKEAASVGVTEGADMVKDEDVCERAALCG